MDTASQPFQTQANQSKEAQGGEKTIRVKRWKLLLSILALLAVIVFVIVVLL